jgi:hypothetical protein
VAGRVDLESQPRMCAGAAGQQDGGARYRQDRHDGKKKNPDWMPERKHTHIYPT